MKILLMGLLLFSSSPAGTAPKPSDTLAAANMAALEQTVDMENNTVETDDVLKFGQSVVDLGEIPVGESRELSLEAVNRSDKPLVLLDAYTSCHCTKVVWDKKARSARRTNRIQNPVFRRAAGNVLQKNCCAS